MTQVKLKRVPIGTLFEWKGTIYIRVKIKMKNCCIPEYTAQDILTGEKAYVALKKIVNLIQG